MMLVVDTNILFSVLIGGKRLKEFFLKNKERITLFSPRIALEEMERLLPKAAKLLGEDEVLLREIYVRLIRPYVTPVPEEEFPKDVIITAKNLTEDVDPTDWPFVALSIHLSSPLWTGDRKLLRLSARTDFKYYTAVDTHALELLLNNTPLEEVKSYLQKKYLQL